MTDNEPSSEPSACVDIDVRGGSGGRMAGVVVLASDWDSGMLV